MFEYAFALALNVTVEEGATAPADAWAVSLVRATGLAGAGDAVMA